MTGWVAVEDVAPGDVVMVPAPNRSLRPMLVVDRFDGRGLGVRRRVGVGWNAEVRWVRVRPGRLLERVEVARPRGLSARQVEVLGVWASGEVASSKQVARRLGLAEKTVNNHEAAAARVLGTSGLAQTLVCAVQRGLVKVPARSTPEAA